MKNGELRPQVHVCARQVARWVGLPFLLMKELRGVAWFFRKIIQRRPVIEIQSEAGFSCCFPRLLRIASFASFFLVFSQACNILQARCRNLAVQKLDPLSSFHSKKYVFLGFQFVFFVFIFLCIIIPRLLAPEPKALQSIYIYSYKNWLPTMSYGALLLSQKPYFRTLAEICSASIFPGSRAQAF